jgi:hypothetical protein
MCLVVIERVADAKATRQMTSETAHIEPESRPQVAGN